MIKPILFRRVHLRSVFERAEWEVCSADIEDVLTAVESIKVTCTPVDFHPDEIEDEDRLTPEVFESVLSDFFQS